MGSGVKEAARFACRTPCLAGDQAPPSVLPMQHHPLASQGSGQGAAQGAGGHLLRCCGWPWLQLSAWQQPARCCVSQGPRAGGLRPGPPPACHPSQPAAGPGGPRGGDCPFLYLPLCNKRPEPCSLLMSVSLPAGRSPPAPMGACPSCAWMSSCGCRARRGWGARSVTAQAWGEHPRHLGLKPFLLASSCVWWALRVSLGEHVWKLCQPPDACTTCCSYINWCQPCPIAALPRDTHSKSPHRGTSEQVWQRHTAGTALETEGK